MPSPMRTRAWRANSDSSPYEARVTSTCGVHAGGIAIDRFDGAGTLLSRGGPATGGCTNGITAGVGDANGSTFLIFSGARDVGFGTDIVGRWFDAAAHSQTDFFAVANGSPQRLAVRALVGGGVAVQIDGTWVATIASGANSVSAPPPWLSENPNHDFTVVRSRRAYAVLPRGSGDPNAITMYSARGNLCGTVTFPVGGLTSGLDGSVIGASGKNGCTKTWWPGLLK